MLVSLHVFDYVIFFRDDDQQISLSHIPYCAWQLEIEFQPLKNILLLGLNILEDRIDRVPHKILASLPRQYKLALDALHGDKSIVIKPADKNLGLVLMKKNLVYW